MCSVFGNKKLLLFKRCIIMKTDGNYMNMCDGIYAMFKEISIAEIQSRLTACRQREERIFLRTVLNLKLQLEQERVIGKELL